MNVSLKGNIIASYISQIYLIVISIAVLPLYIKYMGAEAYGLVGFFAMLQGFFNLLDFGLTPTISRQTAEYNATKENSLGYRQLFRSLNLIFIIIATVGGGTLLLLHEYIALKWLNIQTLNINDVTFSLQVMAISISLRWMTGLYRGVISGFERIVWLSIVNSVIATLRFPGVLVYMYFFGFDLINFFIFQLFVALLEFILLFTLCHKLLPNINNDQIIGWSLKPVKPLLRFALTIAFTSSVWVLITQLDKLVLSGILSLENYGYFTLAVLVSGGILQLSSPISAPIMPRLAKLYVEQDYIHFRKVYLDATQFITVIVVTAGIVLAALAEPVLYAWTNDYLLANRAAPILSLYALGNALLSLAAFPYYLQYAKGNLRYHFIGNIIFAIILIPSIIWAAKNYGGIGAGWAWFLSQLFYLIFWVSYVHIKIEPGINIRWFKSFLPSLVIVYLFMALTSTWISLNDYRMLIVIKITILSIVSLCLSVLSSKQILDIIWRKLTHSKVDSNY